MASTTNVYGLLNRLDSAKVTVRQDRCVMVRNRNASCLRCADACTSGCIALGDDGLQIDPSKCIGCGTCATVCPTCALEPCAPGDAALLAACERAMAANAGDVVFACDRLLEARAGQYDPARVVAVPCLGRVEEALVATLVERGAQRVLLVRGACDACVYAPGLHTAELVCATANLLLETWGNAARVAIEPKLPAAVRAERDPFAPEPGDFYGAVGGLDPLGRELPATPAPETPCAADPQAAPSQDGAADPAASGEPDPELAPIKRRRTHVMANGTLPHFVPDRHERLLDALSSLGAPSPEAVLDTRLWGHVEIDVEACSSCRMCAVFCPTGAIAKFGDADALDEAGNPAPFGIEHFPGDCVKCRCCEKICPTHALRVLDGVRAADLLDGTVERVEMRPVRVKKGGPRSMMNSMRDLLGIAEIYER